MVSLKWSVRRFCAALASAAPTPGGGSAAALAGALGVALGIKVCRLLSSRPQLSSQNRAEIKSALALFKRLGGRLEHLIEKDARAYLQFRRAMRTGHVTSRDLARVTQPPVEICEATARAIKIMERLVPVAQPGLGSDMKGGCSLLQAAFQAALLTAQINLRMRPISKSDPRLRALRKRLVRSAEEMRTK